MSELTVANDERQSILLQFIGGCVSITCLSEFTRG